MTIFLKVTSGASHVRFSPLLLQGETSLFLQPGEELEDGIQDTYILSEDEGLLLRALRPLEDENEVRP